MSSEIKLTHFSPVGFAFPKDEDKFCAFCKGPLNSVCASCVETKEVDKNCELDLGKNMHVHCRELVEKN